MEDNTEGHNTTETDRIRNSILYLAKAMNEIIDAIDTIAHDHYDTGAKPGRTGTSHPVTMELYEASLQIREALLEMGRPHV